MLTRYDRLESLDDLRDFVSVTICQHEQLEVNAFPMTERILLRCGEPCGIYFCIHGPRQVKFSAIWETDNNAILFYGAAGERFFRIELTEAPNLLQVAA